MTDEERIDKLEAMVVSLNTAVMVMQGQYAKLQPLLEKFIEALKEETDDGWMNPVIDLQQRVRALEAKAHD